MVLMLERSPSTSVHGSVLLSWMCSMLPPGDDVGLALAALLHALEDLVLDLQVPGVVVLAGLDDRARGRDRVAAALHLDGVEVRPVGHVVVRVELAPDDVAGLEVDEPVGAGADRLQVGRRLARLAALEGLEQVLGDDHAVDAAEGVGPERRRLLEGDLDGVAVELVDLLDVLVRCRWCVAAVAGSAHELPGEHARRRR